MSEAKWVVHISEKDLLCSADCGFYGNPQWQGYCSQCYREFQSKQKRREDYEKNKNLLSFDKFEAKSKKQHPDKKTTIKNLWRRSPTREWDPITAHASASAATDRRPSPRRRERKLSSESQTAREKFLCFLQELPKPVAHEITRQTRHAIDKIFQHSHLPTDELSELVQDLYQHMNERLCRNMKDSKHSVEDVLEQMERYICVRAYHALFCPKTDEEVADLSLQDRIRSLHWVTAGFLETGLDYSNQEVRDKMDCAITEVIDVNSRREVFEKLDCLVRCSKSIFQALKESRSGAPASADEFLPVLIYVILKANPPLLQSNVKFISRFSLPSKIMTGEAGYYFTNLCCALKFVQNMNADSLKMPKEEFEAYTSGQLVPPLTEANCRCHQAIKSMENSAKELAALSQRKEAIEQQINEFRDLAIRETDELLRQVRAFNAAHPAPSEAVEIADELAESDLPPPLEAEPVNVT